MAEPFAGKALYLAGKVCPPDDWRETIVPDSVLYNGVEWCDADGSPLTYSFTHGGFPSTMRYVGPFLQYGAAHDYCKSVHGSVYGEGTPPITLQQACLRAIDSADIVFAWLDDKSAYGTLIELGYAKAKKKTIWIAGPQLTRTCVTERWHGQHDTEVVDDTDLWFAYGLADELVLDVCDTPLQALTHLLSTPYKFESPIEESFWYAYKRCLRAYPGQPGSVRCALEPQYQVGRYRVDFAHVETKTAIELDGHASHSTPAQIAYDRKRKREIEAMGWTIVGFGGKEVFTDADACAAEAHLLIWKKTRGGN